MQATINSGSFTSNGYEVTVTLENGEQRTYNFATQPTDMQAEVDAKVALEFDDVGKIEVELPDGTII